MRLNVEQRKLIQARPNGHMLIKGVAGSGKTTVVARGSGTSKKCRILLITCKVLYVL